MAASIRDGNEHPLDSIVTFQVAVYHIASAIESTCSLAMPDHLHIPPLYLLKEGPCGRSQDFWLLVEDKCCRCCFRLAGCSWKCCRSDQPADCLVLRWETAAVVVGKLLQWQMRIQVPNACKIGMM